MTPGRTFRVVGPRAHGRGLLVCLEGELDFAGAPLLDETLQAVPASSRLIVDMRPLDYIDSSGIAAVLRLESRLKEAGGALECVASPEGAVSRLFELLGLSELLEVCEEPPPAV
jgi:anti-sigma B factor antagonist